ncbi:hypothetical protein BV22DRAFT_1194918 [Leucogyrophana mollusca]|uniref:Uncharacterized protein n=1 Tax=Leucogyrophana mollusca TaxID=85980 RepID=A0ACB8BKP3_9AGAM|nr:hypothetical protein BV22DRAFT_1194918 [Leucogyrophana mollusca]
MSSKRKYQGKTSSRPLKASTSDDPRPPDLSLYIQAHEADIVRGPQAISTARSLEVAVCTGPSGACEIKAGSGLLEWGGQPPADPFGERGSASGQEVIWVDRYDARLLLDSLPATATPPFSQRPPSPSGWSDLPSDTEDTFFFSPEEIEDYRRDKRRRLIEKNREERLRALSAAEGGDEPDPDPWGGSDEEPDDGQKELIRRTAKHIMSSANPAQLEMRILANHGVNQKFAFLKGRWPRAWRVAKEEARLENQTLKQSAQQAGNVGLGGLVGYGDSDEDSDSEREGKEPLNDHRPTETLRSQCEGDTKVSGDSSEDALKEARRLRAREWAARRRILNSEPQA